MKSPVKIMGGKSASAERIVKAFPSPTTYDVYIEPFGGAAHVLLTKPAYGHTEIFNDKDGMLINFWRALQRDAATLRDEVTARPYAYELYYEYYHSLYGSRKHKIVPDETLSAQEKAVRWFYILRSNMTGFIRSSPPAWTTLYAKTMKEVAERLFVAVQERIKYVAIDNRDGIATIERYAKLPKRKFIYVDPPYIGAEWYYPACREGGFDHEKLAAVLNKVACPVALSYYPHDDLEQWYPVSKWRRVTWQQHKPSNVSENAEQLDIATEMLLMNYEAETIIYPTETRTLWNDASLLTSEIASWDVHGEREEQVG